MKKRLRWQPRAEGTAEGKAVLTPFLGVNVQEPPARSRIRPKMGLKVFRWPRAEVKGRVNALFGR